LNRIHASQFNEDRETHLRQAMTSDSGNPNAFRFSTTSAGNSLDVEVAAASWEGCGAAATGAGAAASGAAGAAGAFFA
jgi:isopentenyl diphosphate isomerase/L-lactate dehydrogenase-like FMN-dependent dehydrogenase